MISTGIYIHLPYCLTKCPYCDFNSWGSGSDFPEGNYTDSVLREIDLYRDMLHERSIDTVFFGGGTPSLFSARNVGMILERINKYSRITEKTESTLEVNPRTADSEKLMQFRYAGINRLSIGIQSFTQRKLDYFKRFCGPVDCFRIIDDVENAGYKNYNLDLMYGAEGESLKELEYDLDCSTRNTNKHISVYCLTIEENTEFGRLYREGRLNLPEDELLSDMYNFTSDYLEDRGFVQYETSNFARPGYECRHNLIYWRSMDYIGFGAGAHSHLGNYGKSAWGERWSNIRTPKHYMNTVYGGRVPVDKREELTKENSVNDAIMMGLRLREGIDTAELGKRYGIELDPESYGHLYEDGFIIGEDNTLRLTRKGFLYSNKLILDIISAIRY